MAEDTGHDEVRNVLYGGASGRTVQAGVVHGGVHFHDGRSPGGLTVVPRQLLAPPVTFVGRASALRELDRAWAGRRQRCGLALVTGPAGIGKSALAMRWSAAVCADFPDGQLYANLGAFDPAGPVAPGVVLGGFLRSLGIPAERVPADTAEQAALFRSTTADRSLLIVLDNAFSAAQVRQLLPTSSGCMVVVTARWRLAALVGDGATVIDLTPLGECESTELLAGTVGAGRVAAAADAVSSLVRLCAGLPIALAVVAARLAAHPRWSIGRVVDELGDEHQRLASLSRDREVSVHAAFDFSYRSLAEPVARCYRALGLHPGADVSVAVMAAALAVPPAHASAMLDTLVESSLLSDVSDDRYRMHDLVRLHARRHAQDDPEREAIAGRIVEWYLAGVRAADVLLTPYRRRAPVTFAHLGSAAVPLADRAAALEWLERERANLVAAVVAGAEATPELAWLIADSMWPLFHYRRHHQDRMTVDEVAVRAAQRLRNREYEARMVKRWAFAHFDLDRFDRAAALFESSRQLFGQLDDRYGVAAAVEGLGMVALAQRRYPAAADHFAEELGICHELRDRRRAGLALLNLGRVANAIGRPAEAVDHLSQAGALFGDLGDVDPYNAARCRLELGRAMAGLGRYDAGVAEVTEALAQMGRLGSPRGQAQARHALGELTLAAGHTAEARRHLVEALHTYERLADAEATEVRRLLGFAPPSQADPHRVPHP